MSTFLKRLLLSLAIGLASPVTTAASTFFYSGAVVTIALSIFEDQISDPLQREAIENRPLGHFATEVGVLAGHMVPNVVYVFVMFALGYRFDDETRKRQAWVMVFTSVFAVIASSLLKSVVLEPRPDGSDRFSFPSGHTTSAFSFASGVSVNNGLLPGTFAFLYAAIVAYSRMNDNRHFFHDVVGGAVLGISYGLAASGAVERIKQKWRPTSQSGAQGY